MESLQTAGVEAGDQLTAIALQANVAATRNAFALWCCGGNRIATWGPPDFGGDSSKVQHHLRSVQQVQATDGAFAAILADGSVVTWGNPDLGGDSSKVQDQLMSVDRIQATHGHERLRNQDG